MHSRQKPPQSSAFCPSFTITMLLQCAQVKVSASRRPSGDVTTA
jgi:hypothetical protein